MNKLNEVKKILKSSYGSKRFSIERGLVTIHYPELRIRKSSGESVRGLDYWVRFRIKSDGTLVDRVLHVCRTTFQGDEIILSCGHPHGGGCPYMFSTPCQGGFTTPINQSMQYLLYSYSKEVFMAFLSDLKVFMEYDNYGTVVNRMIREKRSVYKKAGWNETEEFCRRILSKALESDGFRKCIGFSIGLMKATISWRGEEIISEILKGEGRDDLNFIRIDGESFVHPKKKPSVQYKRPLFKFKKKMVRLKKISYTYDKDEKRHPHSQLSGEIGKIITKSIVERLSAGKKTEVRGSFANRAKATKSNNALV